MIRPEPCEAQPPTTYEYQPGSTALHQPNYTLGARCPQCGHLWAVHTTQTAYLTDGTTSPPGCTMCQSERQVFDDLVQVLRDHFPGLPA